MLQKKKRYSLKKMYENQNMDSDLFALTQKFVYDSLHVYIMTMDMEHNILTDVICHDEEEEAFVRSILQPKMLSDLIEQIDFHFLEDVIDIPTQQEGVVCQVSIIRQESQAYIIMASLAVMDYDSETEEIPTSVMRTSKELYELNVEMLKRIFQLNLKMAIRCQEAQENMILAQNAEQKIQADYIRSAIITDIVQMMESDDDIVEVVEAILMKVCSHLEIDWATLFRINVDTSTVTMVSEWASNDKYRRKEESKDLPISMLPLLKNENYIISSNTQIKDEYRDFMVERGLKATVVFPILMEQQIIMYLSFHMMEKERIWEMDVVRFLSDVRKIIQTILAKRIAQNSLTNSMASLEDILENMGCGILVIDPETRKLLFRNHVLGNEVHNSLAHIDLRNIFDGDEEETEYYVEGIKRWLRINRTRISWVNDSAVELYTLYDITQTKLFERKIEKTSNSDFLTGLYNRMRCEQDLQVLLERTIQNGEAGAILFIDLDDFKHINDGLGHQYGDVLLKSISAKLQQITGIERNCYRVGGDEFMVIITEDSYQELDRIVSQVEDIFKHPWLLKGVDYYCTMSMGACRFPMDADNVEDVVRKADLALYEAKKKGKNQVVFYNEHHRDSDKRRLEMEKWLREACEHPEEEFEVYYQPIIDVSKNGNQCVGAEALVRWNSKELGRMSPAEFIPLAEYLGLIKPIGDYVLGQACKACKNWNDLGHPNYRVNVNFSVVQLLQTDIKDKIQRILEETGLDPNHLTLEVTESLAINDITYMKKLLNSIRAFGVRVALDDFGTGYSSLNHIHELPIDIIKVDRSFIENVGKDEYSNAFIRTISELARTMGMNICVEGVEKELQYLAVVEQGVNMIQGYFFAEPVPLNEFNLKYLD